MVISSFWGGCPEQQRLLLSTPPVFRLAPLRRRIPSRNYWSSFKRNKKRRILPRRRYRSRRPIQVSSRETKTQQKQNRGAHRCVLVCPAVSNPYGSERVVPETAFEGNGRSKKLAEQSACVQALELYRSKRLIGNLKVRTLYERMNACSKYNVCEIDDAKQFVACAVGDA